MRAIATGLAVLALTAPAAARPVPPDDPYIQVATDPPPLPPTPAPDPPRRATIAVATGGMTFASDHDTALERFGGTGGVGILHLTHDDDDPGFEAVAGVAGGDRGRSYTLAARMVVTARLRRKDAIRPFVALGAGFAIARLDEEGDGKNAASGVGIGPSAAVGVHGFLSQRVYWRAGAGFVGAGIGTFSTDLSLGWVIGK
jgi:hypothetical protein